jgi:hypothetical protein
VKVVAVFLIVNQLFSIRKREREREISSYFILKNFLSNLIMLEEIAKRRMLIEQNIAKGFNADLTAVVEENSLFNKGEIEYDELQKAVYADTAQNRKLGRVGQEYHRGKGKKDIPQGGNRGRGGVESQSPTKNNGQKLSKLEEFNKWTKLVEDNVDKFMDYQYSEDAEEVGISKEVAEAFDEILYGHHKSKIFDWKEADDAYAWKNEMERRGYKVINMGEGSDEYDFYAFKKPKEEKK